jgi:hypothetical protein
MFQAGSGEEEACPRKLEIPEQPSRRDGERRPRVIHKWITRKPRPDGVAPLVSGVYQTGNPIRRARETNAAARTNPAPSQSAARRRRSRLSRRWARARRRSSSSIRRSSAGGRGIAQGLLPIIMPREVAKFNNPPNALPTTLNAPQPQWRARHTPHLATPITLRTPSWIYIGDVHKRIKDS